MTGAREWGSNLDQANTTPDSGDWYDLEVEWHDGSGDEPEGEIIVRIHELDQDSFERQSADHTLQENDT